MLTWAPSGGLFCSSFYKAICLCLSHSYCQTTHQILNLVQVLFMPQRNQGGVYSLSQGPLCLVRPGVGMDGQGSGLEKGLGTCLTALLSSPSVSLLSPLLLSLHLPFFCHQPRGLPCASPFLVCLSSSQILVETESIFSTPNENSDPSSLVTEIQKCEENR